MSEAHSIILLSYSNSVRMRSAFSVSILLLIIFITQPLSSQSVTFNNNAKIKVNTSTFIVKTDSFKNDGILLNEGVITVENIFINDDSTIVLGNSIFRVGGDWTNNSDFFSGTGTVDLYGADQQITGDSVTHFYNFTLSGSGIKTQRIDAIVENKLNLNDRELNTDTNKLFVINDDTAAIARDSGFVSSVGDGRLSRVMLSGKNYLFPVGASNGISRYRPITIVADSNTRFEVRMANNNPSDDGFDTEEKEPNTCEVNHQYYHIIESVGGTIDTAIIEFFFDPVQDAKNWLLLANWNGSWENVSPAVVGSDTSYPFKTITFRQTDFANPEYALAIPRTITLDTIVLHNVSCFGGSDGSIEVNIQGFAPLNFHWRDTSDNIIKTKIGSLLGDTLQNITAGNYFLTITDSNGCEVKDTFTITQPVTPFCARLEVTDVSCKGAVDGILCVEVDDPSNYTFLWNNGDTTACSDDKSFGEVATVLITDENGCSITAGPLGVGEPEKLEVEPSKQDVTCFGLNDGQAIASIGKATIGNTLTFCDTASLIIQGQDTFYCIVDTVIMVDKRIQSIVGIDTTFVSFYSDTVVIIDTLIRLAPRVFEVVQHDPLTFCCCAPFRYAGDTIRYKNRSVANGEIDTVGGKVILRIIDTVLTGTPEYSYLWTDDSGNAVGVDPTITGLGPGTYNVTVTDMGGCQDAGSISIQEPTQLRFEATNDDTIRVNDRVDLQVFNEQGGRPPYEYSWSTNDFTNSITVSPDTTTTYTVLVSDTSGCEVQEEITITVHRILYAFPEGFVPEGNNSLFMPVISSSVEIVELKIFNRWGNFLGNFPQGWDGTYSGTLQPMDTYVYQSSILLPDGTTAKETGDFVLIR